MRWRVEEAAMGREGSAASGRRRIGRDQVGAGISPLERSGGAGWILRLPLSGAAARGWEGNAGEAGGGGGRRRRESSKGNVKKPLCVCIWCVPSSPLPIFHYPIPPFGSLLRSRRERGLRAMCKVEGGGGRAKLAVPERPCVGFPGRPEALLRNDKALFGTVPKM